LDWDEVLKEPTIARRPFLIEETGGGNLEDLLKEHVTDVPHSTDLGVE